MLTGSFQSSCGGQCNVGLFLSFKINELSRRIWREALHVFCLMK